MPSDDPIARDAYDELAEEYAATVETDPYNAHLEFPATTGLLPDVEGRRVLDAGCGAGHYTAWLLERGAEVVAVDVSEAMLDHARERVEGVDAAGEDVSDCVAFHRADLGSPLPFDDEAFDVVVSALVLDYVEDWTATFAEFERVLRPGGSLVVSATHPFDEFPLPDEANYFDVERTAKQWSVEVPYYRRPLSAVLGPVLDAGLRLDEVLEPQPTEAFREQAPEAYEKESKRPVFLCLRAVKG